MMTNVLRPASCEPRACSLRWIYLALLDQLPNAEGAPGGDGSPQPRSPSACACDGCAGAVALELGRGARRARDLRNKNRRERTAPTTIGPARRRALGSAATLTRSVVQVQLTPGVTCGVDRRGACAVCKRRDGPNRQVHAVVMRARHHFRSLNTRPCDASGTTTRLTKAPCFDSNRSFSNGSKSKQASNSFDMGFPELAL